MKDTATKLKGQAEDAVGKLKGQAEDTVGKLKGQAEDTVGKLKGQAEDAVGKLKPQAEGEAEEPSEFMNALKNDDFSAMRRMLGDEGSAEPVNEAGAFKGTVPDDTYGNQRGELTDSVRELSEPAEAPSEVADAPEAGLDSARYPDFSQWFNDNGKRLGDQMDRDLDPAGDASGPVERLGENDSFADFLNDNAMEPRFETRYNTTDMTNSAPARPNTPVERTDAAEPEADAEPQFGDKPMTGRAVGDRYGGQQEPSNAARKLKSLNRLPAKVRRWRTALRKEGLWLVMELTLPRMLRVPLKKALQQLVKQREKEQPKQEKSQEK